MYDVNTEKSAVKLVKCQTTNKLITLPRYRNDIFLPHKYGQYERRVRECISSGDVIPVLI
jgi:hypothetical protein